MKGQLAKPGLSGGKWPRVYCVWNKRQTLYTNWNWKEPSKLRCTLGRALL